MLPDTWDHTAGKVYDIDTLYEEIMNTSQIEGITLLGGEPFEQAEALSQLCERVHKSELSIVTFTGYKYEVLKEKNNAYIEMILSCTDLLIDGGFEIENRDLSRPWVGSSNQRYVFLSKRYGMEDIWKERHKLEIKVSLKGKIEINGVCDFEKLLDIIQKR